jgi:flagellar motor switch/type III secretory pathway protein FliN
MLGKDTTPEPNPARAGGAIPERRWEAAERLPCTLSIELSAHGITIGDLLELDVGSMISSNQSHASPVPVRVNGQIVARGDLEVTDDRLAIRITEVC